MKRVLPTAMVVLSVFLGWDAGNAQDLRSIGGFLSGDGKSPDQPKEVPIHLSTATRDQITSLANPVKESLLVIGEDVIQWMWKGSDSGSELAKYGLVQIEATVSQAGMGDIYLIEGNSTAVQVPGNKTIVEGATIRGFAKLDGVFEYQTVMGAPRRIAKVQMVDYQPPTLAQLRAAVAKGDVFKLRGKASETCPDCQGRKMLPKVGGKMGLEPCRKCAGTGSVTVSVFYVVGK